MASIVLDFDRNPNLSDVERLQSFQESVQRAFNELEINFDDLELEKHPLMMTFNKDNQDFKVLFKDYGQFKVITAEAIEAVKGDFKNLYAEMIKADKIIVEDLEAKFIAADEAVIKVIAGELANYDVIIAERLLAIDGEFKNLETKYAKIDQTNIGQAWVEDLMVTGKFLADDMNAATGSFSKWLTGVRIVGALIEAETLRANALILQGTDGIYRRLNIDALGEVTVDSDPKYNEKLDGSVLVKESVTAEHINVYDLFAQNITSTGNFNMGGNGALVYDYEKDELSIRVKEFFVGNSGRTIEEELDDIRNDKQVLNVGARNLIRNSKHMMFDSYGFGHDDFEPFRLKKPTISIDLPKLGRPKLTLETLSLARPKIYLETVSDGKLDAPNIYLSTAGGGTSAVLGKAILGQMVLGRDNTSAVLGEAVLGEMELGNGLIQLDTPVIELVG